MALTTSTVTGSQSGQNLGYIIELILIAAEDVLFVNDPIFFCDPEKPLTVLNGNIGINLDAKLYKIKFRTKSCSFVENQSVSVQGELYSISIDFEFPKNMTSLLKFFHDNASKKWVALFRDANDINHIAGEPLIGMQLKFNRRISNSINNVSVQLSSVSYHSCWFIESLDPDLLFESTFSDEFSEEFDVAY